MSEKKVNKTVMMVNVSDEDVRITIGGGPGDGVTEYVIKPNEQAPFHENYCKPVPGAGRNELPSILSRKSMRTFKDGIRRPALVPVDQAKKVKAEYQGAIEKWLKAGSPAPKPSQPEPAAR